MITSVPVLIVGLELPVAIEHPVTRALLIAIGSALVISIIVIKALTATGRVDETLGGELRSRTLSWLVLVPVIVAPILAGRLWTIAAVTALSLGCYREFARSTGLFRHRLLSAIVALGIVMIGAAAADNWYGLFVALPSLTISIIVIFALMADNPEGYIQRVALSFLAFLLFGVCLGYLSIFANNPLARPLLLAIVMCVELNDVFAYVVGKTIGKRKLAPKTSPNKTIGGSLGAAFLTTTLFATIAHFIFQGTTLDAPRHLIALGLLLSAAGQFGDLVLSSIKRDIGIKDMASTIPGHGGLLDRFDSMLLVAPALFYYIQYVQGVTADQSIRVFTGGGH